MKLVIEWNIIRDLVALDEHYKLGKCSPTEHPLIR